jgi:hypothetical protein
MLGCGHRGTQLAGKLRKPWGTFAATCSIDQAGTSFEHHFGLSTVSEIVSCQGDRVELTRGNRFLQVLDGLLLTAEARALLMVKPSQLLKNLGVVGIAFENARVGGLGRVVLYGISGMSW